MSLRRALFGSALLLLLVSGVSARFLLHAKPELSTDSRAALSAYRSGLAEYHRFRWDRAVTELERAVAADSSFALAHLELGRAFMRLGQRDRAREETARAFALRLNATELERLIIEYHRASIDRDLAESKRCLEELERVYPDAAMTLELRALASHRQGDFPLARKLYERILAKDPERVDTHNQLGYLALETGRYEDAVASFQRYAFYAPDTANPHDSLGEAYLLTGRYHDSYREYLTALEIDPGFISSAVGAVDGLASTGQCQRALTLLETTHESFMERGESSLYEVLRVQVLGSEKKWDAALSEAKHAIGQAGFQRPESSGYRLRLHAYQTVAMSERNEFIAAHAYLDSARRLMDRIRNQYEPGKNNLEEMELLDAALAAYVSVRQDDDPYPALDKLSQVLDRSQRQPHRLLNYRYVLAEGRFLAGDAQGAREIIDEIQRFNPREPRTNLLACKVQLKLRQPAEAIAPLKRYLEIMRLADPDHPGAREAHALLEKLVPSS